MKKSICIVYVSALCVFLFASHSSAFITDNGFLCVNDSVDLTADFQNALDAITSDINEVRLIQGTYPI